MRRHYRFAIHRLGLLLLITMPTFLSAWSGSTFRRTNNAFSSTTNRFSHKGTPTVVNDASQKMNLSLLLIDHYDSFTYNLVDLLAQICTEPPMVFAADADPTAIPSMDEIDGIILSPGPGSPITCTLAQAIVQNNPNTPILGVCLGHQILGHVYGATITHAPTPIHGQVWPVRQCTNQHNEPFWNHIPPLFNVTRYHSLQVTDLPNTQLQPLAYSELDHVVQALRHTTFPHYGVQFHPESIGSSSVGYQLLDNFCNICQNYRNLVPPRRPVTLPTIPVHGVEQNRQHPTPLPTLTVYMHRVVSEMKPIDAMHQFYQSHKYAFWLEDELAMNILGSGSRRVEYYGREKTNKQGLYQYHQDLLVKHDNNVDILSFLQQHYQNTRHNVTWVDFHGDSVIKRDNYGHVSFEYRGGHVGYLGYEVRHDTTQWLAQQEGGEQKHILHRQTSDPKVPTAAFLWADRSMVFDAKEQKWYIIGLADNMADSDEVLGWMRLTASAMRQWRRPKLPIARKNGQTVTQKVEFIPKRSQEVYKENFVRCLEMIRQGESYELCLTNQFDATVRGSSPFALYKVLRRRNPSPFSAFLNWNAEAHDSTDDASLSICCSSPERFVSVKRRPSSSEYVVEAKPIKGTSARIVSSSESQTLSPREKELDKERAQSLQNSIKNRAENLMIVDLLRNDLGRVCLTGSVHVAKLMDIESFTTVHQMVSTIRGTLASNKTAVDVLRACFPGGSMTGAPKLRTMELLDELEGGVSRGPYSGCLGYISVNGSMDMNIVIRTAILSPTKNGNEWNVSIGAGGAITALSESDDEYKEKLLKARAIMDAVQEWSVPNEARLNEGSLETTSNLQTVANKDAT